MTEPSMDTPPRRFSVATDGLTARVALDDADISKLVRGYTIEQHAGQPAMVVLYASATAGAEFDGMAHVAVGQPQEQDPGATIAAFLGNIDPAALERAALDREDLGGGKHDVTRAILQQLADWAQGKA